jgi:hypothetical protein
MPKIIVTINSVGDSKVEVEGESGSRCVEMTAGVEAALAGKAGNREYKPEYDEASAGSVAQSVSGW